MVLAGTGIGAVPDVFAQADVRRNALVRILPDWCFPRMPISAVFPGRKLMPPKTRVFIEMLHAALGEPTCCLKPWPILPNSGHTPSLNCKSTQPTFPLSPQA